MGKVRLEVIAFALGAVLFAMVLRHFGLGETAAILRSAGPAAFLALLLYPFMQIPDVASWRLCFGVRWAKKARFMPLFWMRLAGEAINNFTPFVDIGGEPLKAYLAHRRLGIPSANSVSSVVVSRTSLLLSEAVFMVAALVLSFFLLPLEEHHQWELSVTLGVICAVFIAVLAAQQRAWVGRMNREIPGFYRNERRRFAGAMALNLLGWFCSGIETYVFCRVLNVPVSFWQAFMLEGLVQLVRVASFFIPGNLGAQEGGLAFFVGRLGGDPVSGIGISILKRLRQILWSAIGFAVWTGFELFRSGTRPPVEPKRP